MRGSAASLRRLVELPVPPPPLRPRVAPMRERRLRRRMLVQQRPCLRTAGLLLETLALSLPAVALATVVDGRGPRPGPVRAAADRADQRLILRAALAGPGDHLRASERDQLLPRRPLHAGGVRGLGTSGKGWYRLLAGADPRAARGGTARRDH